MSGAELAGKRVLVVEDEALICMLIEDMLEELGCVIVGCAADVATAAALAQSGSPDLVVLDIHLADGDSYGLADDLIRRGIPVVFATGDHNSAMPRRYAGYPCVRKPFTLSDLREELQKALQSLGSEPTPING